MIDWTEAMCRKAQMVGYSPDEWFPAPGVTPKLAIGFCQMCPLREPCLEGALERNERYGVWGGLTRKERDRVRASRAGAAGGEEVSV